MATEFTPIFVFILLAIFGIAAVMVILSHLLGPRKNTAVKQMPYESGMDPIGDARQRFDVRYYLVAIAFLLFDVELLYLYPWAVAQWSADSVSTAAGAPALPGGEKAEAAPSASARPVARELAIAAQVPSQASVPQGVGVPPVMRNLVLAEILVFVAVLFAAYYYALRRGVFEWR